MHNAAIYIMSSLSCIAALCEFESVLQLLNKKLLPCSSEDNTGSDDSLTQTPFLSKADILLSSIIYDDTKNILKSISQCEYMKKKEKEN